MAADGFVSGGVVAQGSTPARAEVHADANQEHVADAGPHRCGVEPPHVTPGIGLRELDKTLVGGMRGIESDAADALGK